MAKQKKYEPQTVADAEQTLAMLQEKRAGLVTRGAELDERRRFAAYAARGTSAVYAGHDDGKDFDAQIKEIMNSQQCSRDEAISQLHVSERRKKFGW